MSQSSSDIRWKQRFANYLNAYKNLSEAVLISQQRPLNKLEQQGMIQCFEYTHELAWKVMKDFLEAQGETDLFGSKNATRSAFKANLITQGEVWMAMIEARNETSHTYDQARAEGVITQITLNFYPAFEHFTQRLNQLAASQ